MQNFLSEQTIPVGTADAVSHDKHSGVGTEALGFPRLQAPSRSGHQATRGRHFVVRPHLIIAFVSTIKCRTWTQPTSTFFEKPVNRNTNTVNYHPGSSPALRIGSAAASVVRQRDRQQ